jgi:glucose-6-phosphate isomerase
MEFTPFRVRSTVVRMQLPDESIVYQYQSLLVPSAEEWTPVVELQTRHFLPAARLKELTPRLLQVRSQVATERELQQVPPELQPLDAGFIDLPQKTLDDHRRKAEASLLGRILSEGKRLRDAVDRVVVLGAGSSSLGARALFEALRSSYHNELSAETRMGIPRIYFEGDNFDNDAFQDLLDLLQTTCVDPELREERWGIIVISKAGATLETTAACRILKREAGEYYGSKSERLRQLVIPVSGGSGKLRDLCLAEGYSETDLFSIPDNIGERYAVLTAAGLLPAAVMGLDVRALLLGAAAMTKRFLDEPFERNPVLQYAGVNYLLAEEFGKPIRVLSVWSKKLEAVGHWYDLLLAESLAKQGHGPTPLTMVETRDRHTRGQQHQEGARDRLINNLVLKGPRNTPIAIGMADRNEDDLNALSRKTFAELLDAAREATNQAHHQVARPTAELILPALSEHTMGQMMQMLMLATVVEGRLMGVNPYSQPGVEAYQRNLGPLLKAQPEAK